MRPTVRTMKNDEKLAGRVKRATNEWKPYSSREEIKPRAGFISLLIQLTQHRYHTRETRYKCHRQLRVCIIERRCNRGATLGEVFW